MKNISLISEFLRKNTDRIINRDVSYVHGNKAFLSQHILKTHFTYDPATDVLTMIRDMSRFDIIPKEVPEVFMDRSFYFVDDNGKIIKTNYHTIRHTFKNYASFSKKPKSNKSFKKKVFSSFSIPGSSCGFSFWYV